MMGFDIMQPFPYHVFFKSKMFIRQLMNVYTLRENGIEFDMT